MAVTGVGPKLRSILETFNQERARGGKTPLEALRALSADLVEVAEEARRGDRDRIVFVVNLIYILIEVADGRIDLAVADPALSGLEGEVGRSRPSPALDSVLSRAVLQGPPLARRGEPRLGVTVLRLEAFRKFLASAFGLSPYDREDADRLWRRLEAGALSVVSEDLRLENGWRVFWFTEAEAFSASGGVPDADWSYDALGLDWTNLWESYPGSGRDAHEARAVSFAVPLEVREAADRGLRVPTAFDAWGNLGYVTRERDVGLPWPEGGGRTVNPLTGSEGLCEAVHGPLTIQTGSAAAVHACGTVRRKIDSREKECGDAVLDRALQRLSHLGASGP